mgnify:CR=1 FL=1
MMRGVLRVDRQSQGLIARLKKQQQQFLRLLSKHGGSDRTTLELDVDAGVLLAFAYPDRIAKQRRERGSDYVLSNGRAASLQIADGLNYSPYLVAASLGGVAGNRSDSIYLAAALDSRHFEGALADMVTTQSHAEWDETKGRFIAERRYSLGAIVLKSETLRDVSAEEQRTALLDFIRRRGLGVFDWSELVQQWRARVSLLGRLDCAPGNWPDVSDEGLLATLDVWLSPYLDGVNSLQGIKRLDLAAGFERFGAGVFCCSLRISQKNRLLPVTACVGGEVAGNVWLPRHPYNS